jgi:hypothetical protein
MVYSSRIKKISDATSGSYAFSFGSEGALLFGSAMLWAALNANHYALLNLENTAANVCSPLNQSVIPSISFS